MAAGLQIDLVTQMFAIFEKKKKRIILGKKWCDLQNFGNKFSKNELWRQLQNFEIGLSKPYLNEI
jgi:hypothetical protein